MTFKDYRMLLGVTQYDAAQLLKVRENTIWRWESGRATPPHSALIAMQYFIDRQSVREPTK